MERSGALPLIDRGCAPSKSIGAVSPLSGRTESFRRRPQRKMVAPTGFEPVFKLRRVFARIRGVLGRVEYHAKPVCPQTFGRLGCNSWQLINKDEIAV